MDENSIQLSTQTTDLKEYRRFRAWELRQEGWTQRRIAEALGVTQGAVSQWLMAHSQQPIIHKDTTGEVFVNGHSIAVNQYLPGSVTHMYQLYRRIEGTVQNCG